ncbi:hypothetical protein ABIA33_001274 [Streptacidiphilus sp. MAP12-16]|jgi:hypothetical protein|uniref:hypothetical protein n=1 Tax=Streptacidiphilus sp. MAP12-16 TaxID=3156300 RepID=UPI003515E354
MDTTSHTGAATAEAGPGTPPDRAARRASAADATIDGYMRADFPWYSLDDGWTGRRWLAPVGTAPDGTVDYGSIGHGDEPVRSYATPEPAEGRRYAVVVTVARRPGRRLGDGTGILEATSVSSAAWLAGAGLLAATEQSPLARELRQNWLDQQTALAWDLADDLDGPGWSSLTLPINGTPQPFRYRESEYGWVLAGNAPGVHLGAYGRGVSAYGIGFTTVTDLAVYAE